jgi:hypothetical protein
MILDILIFPDIQLIIRIHLQDFCLFSLKNFDPINRKILSLNHH